MDAQRNGPMDAAEGGPKNAKLAERYFVYWLMMFWSCLTASLVSWATTLR
jgi:hypothetical protein